MNYIIIIIYIRRQDFIKKALPMTQQIGKPAYRIISQLIAKMIVDR